jgi:REP element-mobilizing transposase RayT
MLKEHSTYRVTIATFIYLRCLTSTAKPPPMAVRKTKALPCAGLDSAEVGCKRNFVELYFWARGYCVSTVGLDEAMIREYIRTQEEQEKKEEQIQLNY